MSKIGVNSSFVSESIKSNKLRGVNIGALRSKEYFEASEVYGSLICISDKIAKRSLT